MNTLRRAAAWLPAVILPTATFDQLWTILRADSAAGVSALTWTLFLLANVGALCLGRPDGRLGALQMALAFGLTALLDLAIVVRVLAER